MTIGRHNQGKFAQFHGINDPIITSYNDAYSYLVKNPNDFKLEDAAAVHLFDLRLAKSIRQKEAREGGKIMTTQEIDEYIDDKIGTDDLNEIFSKVETALAEYRRPKRRLLFWNVTWVGAWQGVCGNVLSFLVLLLVGLIVASLGHDPSAHVVRYYHDCVATLLPGADGSSTK